MRPEAGRRFSGGRHGEQHNSHRIGWLRMLVWGTLAMGITAPVGRLAGAVVSRLAPARRVESPRQLVGPALVASGEEQGAEQQQQQGRNGLDLDGGEGQGRRQGGCQGGEQQGSHHQAQH